MATYSKVKLSGAASTNVPYKFNATQHVIHQAGAGTTTLDEVWLWISNAADTDSLVLAVSPTASPVYSTSPARYFRGIIPANTTMLILSGIIITDSATIYLDDLNGSESAVGAFGYVNRITP